MSKYPVSVTCPKCGNPDFAKRGRTRMCRSCLTRYTPVGSPEEVEEPDDDPEQSDPGVVVVPPDRAEALVRKVAEKFGAKVVLQRLGHFRPDHLANAMARFAHDMSSEEVPLAIIDTSLLNNARAGILITNRQLYSSFLRRSIPLQDVLEVAYEAPDGLAFLWVTLIVSAVCIPIGVLLLIHFLWTGGLRKLQHRLLVNGRVVLSTGKRIRPEFWCDLLTTLAGAARGEAAMVAPADLPPSPPSEHVKAAPQSIKSTEVVAAPLTAAGTLVTGLEMLPHSAEGVSLDGEVIDDPTWDQIEQSIRELDGHAHPLVRLWTGPPWQSSGLEIVGGGGKYALRQVGDEWVYYDPNGPDEEVQVQTSGTGHRCAGYYVCTDLGRVLRIARRFCETGAAGDDEG